MKEDKDQKPKVHRELEGFEFKIDEFGEISSTLDIESINAFLNKNVDDKKLKDRSDIDDIKNKKNK